MSRSSMQGGRVNSDGDDCPCRAIDGLYLPISDLADRSRQYLGSVDRICGHRMAWRCLLYHNCHVMRSPVKNRLSGRGSGRRIKVELLVVEIAAPSPFTATESLPQSLLYPDQSTRICCRSTASF